MKRSIALVLVMVMFMTMLSPMHSFGSEHSRINLFYLLDPSVQSNPNVDLYGISMQVSTSQNGSLSGQSGGSLYNFTNYAHTSAEVGMPVEFASSIENYKTESFYYGNHSVDTTVGGDRIITIGFDPDLGQNAITFTETPVPIDVTFTHEDPSYQVSYQYESGSLIRANKAVMPGSYQMFYTKYTQEASSNALQILSEEVSIDGVESIYVGMIAGPTNMITTQIETGLLDLRNDNLVYRNQFLTDLSTVSSIETNLFGLERFIAVESGENRYEMFAKMLELNTPIDITAIQAAPTGISDFAFGANLNQLFVFTDANAHPIHFNSIKGGYIDLSSQNGGYSGPMDGTYLNFGGLSGPTTVTLDIPELGISATRTININSGSVPPPLPGPSYKDVQIEINDFTTGTPKEGVYAVYEQDKNYITIYVPENSVSELIFRGVDANDVVSEPLNFNLNTDTNTNPQYFYDNTLKQLNLGAVQGGYRDMISGSVGNIGVSINVYKGTLGKLTLENYDSTEANPSYFSGEVQYSISYKLTDGSNTGSMSNGWAHDGVFFIPMQDGALGVSYAYSVLSPSPSHDGVSVPQANTKFIDFSDKLAVVNNGFIELGSAKFQEPTFKGIILNKDGNPASELHTSLIAYINSEQSDIDHVYFNVGMWPDQTTEQNTFYFAPLGESFADQVNVNVVSRDGSLKPIESNFLVNDTTKTFQEVSDQLIVTMYAPDGALMESGPGLDRSIYMFDDQGSYSKNVYFGNGSTASIGSLEEGVTYTLQLMPDLGDFGHRRYVNGKNVTFTYTTVPGAYEAVDTTNTIIPYTVDANGVMHLPLSVQFAQVYGQIKMGDVSVTPDTSVILYEKGTQNEIGRGRVHTDGGYNNMPLVYGLFLIGNDTPLTGEYTLVVEDPKDTVMYSGTTVNITLPLIEPLSIELPKSKVFGNVTLNPEDTLEFANNITRVYVNVFDATGQFLKNVLVRRDGMFSVGELASGKYFAKVFVSPFSTLASKYASSRMTIFNVDNTTEDAMHFNANLTRVIGEGIVYANGIPKQEAWVRIYNAQGAEVEAIKSNDNGIFKIPMLPDGNYKVRAFGTDGFTDSLMGEFMITAGLVTSGPVELNLTNPQLTGLTVDSNQDVIGDVTAMLFDKDKNLISSVRTQNGSFDFGGLEHGNYFVQVRPNIIGTYVPSKLIEINYSGEPVSLNVILENASYQGKVFTPTGGIQKSGWVHVYLDNIYETSVQIDQLGQFVLGEFDPSRELSIVAEDDMGRFMPSEKIILDTPENIELGLRSDIGYKTSLMYGADFLVNTKYIVYDALGNALYQGKTNAFGELTLVDVPFGEYTVVVPMETSYLIGHLNFTFDGQHFAGIPLIKGDIK